MNQENKRSKPVTQELSQPELALYELNGKIWEAQDYLMNTFFPEDTWLVRQAGAYGSPLLEYKDDLKGHDWVKEKNVIDSIASDLGDRLGYYQAAYHFPDVLSAYGIMTKPDWVEMKVGDEPGKSRLKAAEEILEEIRKELAGETVKFEGFLKSDKFKKAFKIKVDNQTGEYQINDLNLDENELRTRWQSWFGINASRI